MAGRKTRAAIGIDLGTTYSCVAVWKNERVEIISNDQGNRITPSYVAFNDSIRMIGEAARNQVARNPTNTVFSKLSGTITSVECLQFMALLVSYTLVAGPAPKGNQGKAHFGAARPRGQKKPCLILGSGGANPAMGAAYPGTDDAQPETDEFEEIFECCCS
ncbi:hypothetical protein C5167_007443 [Papaver somniferum]|nr:hypothetical protein C5167_007443 [Papaver somniferum]